ncbi:MAG: COG1470 family protein [Thermoplasmatota archaeon]
MRSLWLALLLVASPLAAAQAPAAAPAPLHLLDDPQGDVTATAGGQQPVTLPAGETSFLDLVSLVGQEQQDSIVLTLGVAALNPPSDVPLATTGFYGIIFLVHDTVYEISITRGVFTGTTPSYFGSLAVQDPNSLRFTTLQSIPVTIDATANTMTVSVPRQVIVDSHGASPYPGVNITGFHVVSHGVTDNLGFGSRFSPGGTKIGKPLSMGDRMPDVGNGSLDMPIQIGVRQSGHASLSSPDPVRFSNGEATTFVYQVQLHNLAQASDKYAISASDIPANWQVTVPPGEIQVGAGESQTFPVVLTVPFAHQHGSFLKFTVAAQSESDAGSTGRINLGILYPYIPQPAGHHHIVYFHGASTDTDPNVQTVCTTVECGIYYVYMNAIQDDPAIPDATKEPQVPAQLASSGACGPGVGISCDTGTGQATYQWSIDLQPALQMGIAFDLSQKGSVEFPISTTLPMKGAVLSGALVHYDPPDKNASNPNNFFGQQPLGRVTILAHVDPTAPQDIQAQTSSLILNTSVTPNPAASYTPYEKGAALQLILNLTFTRVDVGALASEAPVWIRGGQMALPLFEYHDPIGESFALTTMSLTPDGASQRSAAPGHALLFNLTLSNQENQAAGFGVSVGGVHGDWATLLTPKAVNLAGYSHAQVQVAVHIPAGAVDADRADVLVRATNTANPNLSTIAQLHAVVDSKATADDSALVQSLTGGTTHRSPGFEVVALGIVLLALSRRRRGR